MSFHSLSSAMSRRRLCGLLLAVSFVLIAAAASAAGATTTTDLAERYDSDDAGVFAQMASTSGQASTLRTRVSTAGESGVRARILSACLAAEGGATLGQRGRGLLLDEAGQLGGFSIKGRVKSAQLPTSGRIRYVPPTGYKPSMPLPRGSSNGYIDRFGNEWVRGPSRTAGEAFEWDVQLSRTGREQLGWLSSDGSHVMSRSVGG